MADIKRRLQRLETAMGTLRTPTDDKQALIVSRTSIPDRDAVIHAMRRLRGVEGTTATPRIHCEFEEIAPLLPDDVRERVSATIRAVDDELR